MGSKKVDLTCLLQFSHHEVFLRYCMSRTPTYIFFSPTAIGAQNSRCANLLASAFPPFFAPKEPTSSTRPIYPQSILNKYFRGCNNALSLSSSPGLFASPLPPSRWQIDGWRVLGARKSHWNWDEEFFLCARVLGRETPQGWPFDREDCKKP